MKQKSIASAILSGIQPTGKLHLGNYLGAINNWVVLQEKYHQNSKIFFSIVDLHALSDRFKSDHDLISYDGNLKDDTITMAATLLAAGIDPNKSTLFVQSHVPEHSELCWILSCIAPMSWLNKMTQYKDKKSKSSSLGLFSYPVLQAADILLYRADKVPVGDDQIQHVELTRDYALRFNSLFCRNSEPFFPLPEAVKAISPRIMNLKDATKKMSKSDPVDASRINLTDDPELIYHKIIKAKTDSIPKIRVDSNRPEVSNLIRIYCAIENKTKEEVELEFEGSSLLDFKEKIAQVIIKRICPISDRFEELIQDKEKILKILEEGNEKAREVANKNIIEIKKLMGMLR